MNYLYKRNLKQFLRRTMNAIKEKTLVKIKWHLATLENFFTIKRTQKQLTRTRKNSQI